MPQLFQSIISKIDLTALVDIGITALLIYWLFSLIRGTRAVSFYGNKSRHGFLHNVVCFILRCTHRHGICPEPRLQFAPVSIVRCPERLTWRGGPDAEHSLASHCHHPIKTKQGPRTLPLHGG